MAMICLLWRCAQGQMSQGCRGGCGKFSGVGPVVPPIQLLLPLRDCGCPALALFARAGTMLPTARDLDLKPLDRGMKSFPNPRSPARAPVRSADSVDNYSNATARAIP